MKKIFCCIFILISVIVQSQDNTLNQKGSIKVDFVKGTILMYNDLTLQKFKDYIAAYPASIPDYFVVLPTEEGFFKPERANPHFELLKENNTSYISLYDNWTLKNVLSLKFVNQGTLYFHKTIRRSVRAIEN